MKRSFPGLVAVVALALLAGLVPALAFKVDVTYDPAVNFHAYRTYSWKPGTPARETAGRTDPWIRASGVEGLRDEARPGGRRLRQHAV